MKKMSPQIIVLNAATEFAWASREALKNYLRHRGIAATVQVEQEFPDDDECGLIVRLIATKEKRDELDEEITNHFDFGA
jgi:hypothetical protein